MPYMPVRIITETSGKSIGLHIPAGAMKADALTSPQRFPHPMPSVRGRALTIRLPQVQGQALFTENAEFADTSSMPLIPTITPYCGNGAFTPLYTKTAAEM